jgi:N-acetyltransferase
MIPPDLTLETTKVFLRPVTENDYDDFLRIARQDENMWAYFVLNLANPEHLKKWMNDAIRETKANTRLAFTIIDKPSEQVTGSMSFLNISFYDKKLEIGSSWLGKDFRSTGINKHAKYAMMRYAFEELNFERVEYKTDVLNARARKGLEKIGGIEEGVLRSHMTMWNDRRRTSIYYSVLKNEWPGLKQTIFKELQG